MPRLPTRTPPTLTTNYLERENSRGWLNAGGSLYLSAGGSFYLSAIAVLGCGSIGAPVALALAQTGVGALALVDPESIEAANVGRHPLGMDAVGESKAKALAKIIRSRLPHVKQVDPFEERWDEALRLKPEILGRSDLIVCAIGDWGAESALNEWHVVQGRGTPIVYGWAEAYACAGHALAVLGTGGCLQCGFSSLGEPLLRVTDWPQGTPTRQAPACGESFQPYGPVEISYVSALVSELALDCLMGTLGESTERTWAARWALIRAAGGQWTSEWKSIAAGREYGGFIEERRWPRAAACRECGAVRQ